MSVHNFYMKLFVFTTINHLHAYTINNINHDENNDENSIESVDDAPRRRHIRHQRTEIDEEIPEMEDLDLKKEIRREIIHRIIERRLQGYETDEESRPERITNGRMNGNLWRSRLNSANDKPYIKSGWREENRRTGDTLGSIGVEPINIKSDITEFNSKWKPIRIEPDHRNLAILDINTSLEPEKYNIISHQWKPIIDSDVDSGKVNNNILGQQNKGTITHNRWKHIQENSDHLNEMDINSLMEPENKGTRTIQRWTPIRIYTNAGKVNRNNLLGAENEDTVTNHRWKVIRTETDNSGKIKINDLLESDEDKIVINKDVNKDLNPVLTVDDIQEITLAIQLNWLNVNQDEFIEIFRSYWYKLLVMIDSLKGKNDQIQRNYLLWLLKTLKVSVINNPEYINLYLKSSPNVNESQNHKESDSETVNQPLELHETPKNKLTIDMLPPKGLIRKICDGVNQNVEDFWKIFYRYFSKQPKDRENLQNLEKLYLILTIFTQFHKAEQLGMPIEVYVDKIINIIAPDIKSLGSMFNNDNEPSKPHSNIACISCNTVNDLMENEKLSGEKVKILPQVPYDTNYVPKVEHKWHTPEHKNVAKPVIEIVESFPDTIHLEAKTINPILDLNKHEGKIPNPLPNIKEPEHFKEIELDVEKNIRDWERKDDIHNNHGDTTFVKPVLDGNKLVSDIKNLSNAKHLVTGHGKLSPGSGILETKTENPIVDLNEPKTDRLTDLDHLNAETIELMTNLDEIEPINSILKPLNSILDLDEKPIPDLERTEEITVEPMLELHDWEAKTMKPMQDLFNIIKKPVKLKPDSDDPRANTIKPISVLNKLKEIIAETVPHLYDSKGKTIKLVQDVNKRDEIPVKPVPDSYTLLTITENPIPELDVIKPILHSDDLPDNTIKPISDKDKIYKSKTIMPIQDKQVVNNIDETPIKSVPDSDNLQIITVNPISESDNIEKITVYTMADLNNIEENTIEPLKDLLNIDVIKPVRDSDYQRAKHIKPISDIDKIKEIILNTVQDLNNPEAEKLKPIQNVDNVDTKPIKPIPEIIEIEEKPVRQTPALYDVVKKLINPIPNEEAHILNPIPDTGNTEVKPLRIVPHINESEHSTGKQQNKRIHGYKIPNEKGDTLSKFVEKWKNTLNAHVFTVKRVKTVEPGPHLFDLEAKTMKPLPNVINEDKNTMKDPNNFNPNIKDKIINLNGHHPDVSIQDVKNIIQQGKLIPQHEKIDVQDNPQIMSPHGINMHVFEVKHPDLIKNIKENSKVPKPIQHNEYFVQPDANNWSSLPEIENQILSKNITPSDKNNIKANVSVDKTYNYVVKKRPFHLQYNVVDIRDPKTESINKIEPKRPSLVDLISNDSIDFLTRIIILYVKGLVRKLGLDIFITSINFDMLTSPLVNMLVAILKALRVNGVSTRIILQVILEIHNKMRLFELPELQECLHKVSSVIVDIIASVVKTIVKDLSKSKSS